MVNGVEGFGGYYLSAYGIAVKHGFHGTEEDWLEHLRAGELQLKLENNALFWKTDKDSDWIELSGYRESIEELQKLMQTDEATLEQMQQAVETLKNETQQITADAVAEMNRKYSMVEGNAADLLSDTQNSVSAEIAQMQTEKEKLETAVQSGVQKNEQLQQKTQELSEQIGQMQTTVSGLSEKAEQVQTVHDEILQSVTTASNTVNEAVEQAKKVTAAAENTLQAESDYQTMRENFATLIDQSQSVVEQLEEQRDELGDLVAKSTEDIVPGEEMPGGALLYLVYR